MVNELRLMWRPLSLTVLVSVAAYGASMLLENQTTVEERDAMRSKEMAYEILRTSMSEYNRRVTRTEDQSFEDFLRTEWPQDFKHYTSGMRSYDEWKKMFEDTS